MIALLGDSHRAVDPDSRQHGAANNHEACDDEEIAKATSEFFSAGAKGLSDVLAKALKEKRRPFAYIRGEEFGGVFDQTCSP